MKNAKKGTGLALRREHDEMETAPLEAYGPMSLCIEDKDYIIRACDGDHEYVYMAFHMQERARTYYQVVEVYPGLKHKDTSLREARDAKDLVLTDTKKLTTIDSVCKMLTDIMFADFEVAPAPGNVRLLAAVNS
jgi:hypothetical protein